MIEELPPFAPVWPGDVHAGHHRSCGVRVKNTCTCSFSHYLLEKDQAANASTGVGH